MVLPVREQDETVCLALVSSQYTLIQPGAALVDAVLAMVESHALAPAGIPMPHSRAALQVARCLVCHPADRRTLEQWAAELHLSRRSLERAFLAETGLAWKRWRQACRMTRAAQLLRDTANRSPGSRSASGSTPTAHSLGRSGGTTGSARRPIANSRAGSVDRVGSQRESRDVVGLTPIW